MKNLQIMEFSNTLLNIFWMVQEMKIRISQNKWKLKSTHQNLYDTIKAVLRGVFIGINALKKKKILNRRYNFTLQGIKEHSES